MNQRDKLILFAIVAGGIIFYLTRPTKQPTTTTQTQTTTQQTQQTQTQQTTRTQQTTTQYPPPSAQTGGIPITLYNPSNYLIKIEQAGNTIAEIQPFNQGSLFIYTDTPVSVYVCQTSYACSLCQELTPSANLTLDASTLDNCAKTAPPDFSETFPVTIENTCSVNLAVIVQNLAGYGPQGQGTTSYATYKLPAGGTITINAPNFSTVNVVNPNDFSEVYQNLPINGSGGTLRVWNCPPPPPSTSSSSTSSTSTSQQCYFTVFGPYGQSVKVSFNGNTYTVPPYAPLNIDVPGPGTYTLEANGKTYTVQVNKTFAGCYGSVSV